MSVEKKPEKFSIVDCLTLAIDMGASDVHLRVDEPPVIRKDGRISRLDMPPVTERQLGICIDEILPKVIRNATQSSFDIDFAYTIKGLSRFRVNLCRQLDHTALVFRVVPYNIKTVSALNLPQSILQFTELSSGIVLVTGPTGSGKSTTIASLMETINQNYAKHIVTIEDPVEFIYTNKKCLITQRQVGVDTDTFAAGVKYAMRQDPDIILIGEIRDKETLESALKAAETGHLVFATLHTNDAIQTVNRVINLFDPSNREFIRHQLAQTLRGTVAQKLIPRSDIKGRIPACEIMVVTPTVKDLIIKNELDQIYELVRRGTYNEMLTLNMSLHLLARNKIISTKDALANSNKENELQQMLRGAYQGTVKQ